MAKPKRAASAPSEILGRDGATLRGRSCRGGPETCLNRPHKRQRPARISPSGPDYSEREAQAARIEASRTPGSAPVFCCAPATDGEKAKAIDLTFKLSCVG
jgi:hypothetical protein